MGPMISRLAFEIRGRDLCCSPRLIGPSALAHTALVEIGAKPSVIVEVIDHCGLPDFARSVEVGRLKLSPSDPFRKQSAGDLKPCVLSA
jgi:hypothetical protein